MEQLLSRLLIEKFYKLNAGFFLVIFIALFGIMSGVDTMRLHYALMQSITSSGLYMCAGLAVFTLYNFKCTAFGLKELNQPENSFLYHMQGLPNARQLLLYLYCHSSLYLPVMVYGLITAYVGFSTGHIAAGCVMVLWQGLMCVAGAGAYFYRLNTTWKHPAFRLPSFQLIRHRGYYSYLLGHSLYARKGAVIGIKLFSLLLLQFLVSLNADKPSKENICFLIFLCISTHALLPLYYVDFVENQLGFLRNMPLPLWRRLALYLVTYAVLFIPELLFLLWNERNVLPMPVILSLYALAVSRLMLYTAAQYVPKINTNNYTGLVFAMFFATLILIASLNLWLFAVAEFTIATVLFVTLYYRYEPNVQPAAQE